MPELDHGDREGGIAHDPAALVLALEGERSLCRLGRRLAPEDRLARRPGRERLAHEIASAQGLGERSGLRGMLDALGEAVAKTE